MLGMLLIHLPADRSSEMNKEVTVNGRTFLYGEINREGLTKGQYNTWFSHGYNKYQFNQRQIDRIKPAHLNGITVKLLMSTWCGDSKRNVPVFFKFMDEIDLKDDQLQAWALDLRKSGPNQEQVRYKVSRVPTIIFYRNGTEIGRFVERPKPGQRLEQLWTDILTKP